MLLVAMKSFQTKSLADKVFDKLEEWEQQRNISCIQALISHKIKVEDYSKSKKIL